MTEQVEKVALERLINIGVGAVLNHPSNRITISHEALAIALPAILAATPPDDSVARIVAWLRRQCSDPMLPDFAEFLSAFADAIERGDWR